MANITQSTMDWLTARRDKAAENLAEAQDKMDAARVDRDTSRNIRDNLNAIIAESVVIIP